MCRTWLAIAFSNSPLQGIRVIRWDGEIVVWPYSIIVRNEACSLGLELCKGNTDEPFVKA